MTSVLPAPGPHLENHWASLSWAGFLASLCKMNIQCPSSTLLNVPSPQAGGCFLVIDSWQNSWVPLAPPSPRQTFNHNSPICYSFLSLSLLIRDGGSCGNREDTPQSASGISAIPPIICSPMEEGLLVGAHSLRHWSYATELV